MKGLSHPAFLIFGHTLAGQQMDLAVALTIESPWVLGCFYSSSLSTIMCKLRSG